MMVGLVKMTALTNIRQTIKHCFFAAILAKNLAQTLKLDVKSIELRAPNVQEDKKISRG